MTEAIRRALETRLDAMTPQLATAFENVSYTPVDGTPYQRANVLPATPDNSTKGAGMRTERGVFQVTLFYPEGVGSADAQARADAIVAWFKRGTSMTNGGVTTIVTHTPAKAGGFNKDGRYVVPVSIRYQADIFG